MFLFAFVIVPFYKSCKQKEIVAKLKTIHSSLLQANSSYCLQTSEVNNDYNQDMSAEEFAKTYFKPYMPVREVCEGSQNKCWKPVQYVDLRKNKFINKITYSLVLKNGVVLGFTKDKNNSISIIADINGTSGENKLGKDVFIFSFYDSNLQSNLCKDSGEPTKFAKPGLHLGGLDKCGIPFDSYSYSELQDKTLPDGCNKAAQKFTDGNGAGAACLALIYKSNWAIDKKYPW